MRKGTVPVRRKWLLLFLLLPLLFLAALLLYLAYPPGHIHARLQSGGVNRSYLLYVPSTLDPSRPAPLVISIHGFASWPQNQSWVSRWNRLAEQYGFLVAYPAGTGLPLRWNTGLIAASSGGAAQEMAFINDLIDTLLKQYNLDPNRIYANGLSNGGGMSHLLACRLSERIAAIGGVAGAYIDPPGGCQPARPVPVIAFHGTADPIVPYEGGPLRHEDARLPQVASWAAAWAERNGCAPQPQALPEAGEVSAVRYTGCAQDSEVVFYSVHGGGHTWPGGEPLPQAITGPTTRDVDASALMWDFFSRHPLP